MSEHAIRCAAASAKDIREGMTALRAIKMDDSSSVAFDGEEFATAEELRERLEERPLSVLVRDGWRSPSDDGGDPVEFEILLATGGPALRIIGELENHAPSGTVAMQWQDWGTLWTDYAGLSDEERDALKAFAELFWFGE